MPAEPAVADFLDVVRRSGIVPGDTLEQMLGEFRARTDLDTPARIADELVAREVLTRWQADKLLQGKFKNFVLGPYCILRPLGRGGMGTVYLAQHVVMRRRCAIKVLPPRSPKDDSSMLDRFYREAQAVAALDHPNIVRAYDVNKEVQKNTVVHYLVMEYVEGQDLQAKVDEHGVLGYREAAEYVRQAAEGLAHAHEAGLVHRDVKPANLLVDSKGVVKVLDLGLARFYDEGEGASLTNQFGDTVLGTVDYLAPEQALDCHEVDARADIYSLGQTLYFLLTGHPPFPQGSVAQRLLAHQTRSPEPIEHERPDVPVDLVVIYEGMTAKNPEDRYQTAGEVAETLGTWLSDRPGDSGFLPRAASLRPAPRPAGKSDPTRALPRTARPSAPAEATRASSSPAEDTELELAPLEDETPAPPSGSGANLVGGGEGSSPTDPAVPQAAEEAASSSKAPSSDGPSSEGEETPALVQDLPDLPPPETDWMSTLLQEEALPAVHADATPRTLPSLTRPEGRKAARKESEQSPVATLVRLPAFWVGVAGAIVTGVLIVAVVVSLSTPGQDSGRSTASLPSPGRQAPEASGSSDGQTPSDEVAEPSEDEGVEPTESAEPQPEEGSARAKGGEGEVKSPPPGNVQPVSAAARDGRSQPTDQPGPPPVSADRDSAGPSGGAKSRPTPDGGRPRRHPVEGPAAPEAGEENRGAPASTQAPASQQPGQGAKSASTDGEPPKLDPAELQARFAAVSQLSFQLTSADRNPNSKLNLLVKQQAIQAAERAGLAIANDQAVVMHLALETTEADGLVGFVLSAELKCREGDSQELTVWKHQELVATLAQHLLRRPTIPAPLKTGVSDFFDRFVDDFRQAKTGTPRDDASKPKSG